MKRKAAPKKKTAPKKKNTQKQNTAPIEEEDDLDEYRIVTFKPKDNYQKTSTTKQDEISENIDEIKKRFEGFKLIKQEEFPTIQPGTYIRYLKGGKLYRAGGVLVLNKSPKYWVLQSTDGRKIRWSVPLQTGNNRYFRKDPEIQRKLEENKKKLYKAVVSGKYVLMKAEEYQDCLDVIEGQQGGGKNPTSESETDESSSINWDVQLQ